MSRRASLTQRDAAHLWHPYTQHGSEPAPLPVAAASGAWLELEDGTRILDAISSWWACLHGHGRPELVEALARQVRTLDHVLFAGATHEPAVGLAEELLAVAPAGLTRVFYSDNGSTAVEVALKMVYQRWVHLGEAQRRTFVCLEGAYHGDTFGSMAIGDPDPFFTPFAPLLFEVRRVAPEAAAIEEALDELGTRAAGLVIEPMLQGAAGMRVQDPALLHRVRAACDAAGVPLIADEVLTGFGRTGTLFACEHAGISPDLLCLAKGLTGGTFPLAATLATAAIFEAFLADDRSRAFFHGHTFTANPVGCAVARASLRLCLEDDVPGRFDRIGRRIERGLEALRDDPRTSDLRRIGGVVALDLQPPPGERPGYLASVAPRLRAAAVERGVLLRPLGNVLYAMPPACTDEGECDRIAEVMVELARLAR